ncbi:MAG TPA: MBL fold metallo-hydrolase [Gemmatimonadales bacterium]|nr:MBL fold metallo-hydrolase [Gemmatimonadales bacterium]
MPNLPWSAGCILRVASAVSVVLILPRDLSSQARDASARMERVAEGVFAIIHNDATDEWPHGNTGVVVTDSGVLVVDATYLPSRAKADIALIRSVTRQPVRYLVYTHWHFDHNNGTSAYAEAFPGLTIVSERESSQFIALNATWWAKMSTAPNSVRRAALAALETQVANQRDSTGHPLSAEACTRLTKAIGQRKAELDELASLRVVPPNLVFDHELILRLGGRRIELRDRGRANSPHDVTVFLPDERVLFSGDILVQSPLPYVGASWPVPWIEVLRQLETIPIAALVPGHGPVMHDHSYTRQVRELLEAATSRVAAMAREGKTLEQIQGTISLDDIRAKTPAWRPAELNDDWVANTKALVERAWRGVRGQGG